VTASLRFTEILTTATAIASYLGADEIGVFHVQAAVAVLRHEVSFSDLGPAPSPLVPRSRSTPVAPPVRALVQRWFVSLGSDPMVEVGAETVDALLADLNQVNASS